jgi:hypothetical protein
VYASCILRLFGIARGLLPQVKNGRNRNFGVTCLPESLSGIGIFLFCLSYFSICLVGLWHDACDSILTHLVNLVLE